MSTSSGPKAIVNPTIFGEYIGVKPYPRTLTHYPGHIINPQIEEFIFILGFATEDYDNNGRGTGHFNRKTWNDDYFGAKNIKILKKQHKNAKVLISIGGVGTEYPFNPAEKEVWSSNAIDSLRQIINSYGDIIDGIDINYEFIYSNDVDFNNCIGPVINDLKNTGLIKLVSIAPSDKVQSPYRTLYGANEGNIDLVNYKFYNQNVPSAAEFISLYGELSKHYPVAKLLAGFSTDPDVQVVTREVFLEGCKSLLKNKSLRGIFVWNANDSAAFPRPNENPFRLEEIAQILLVNPPN